MKKKVFVLFFFLILEPYNLYCNNNCWTWSYKKKFSAEECGKNFSKKILIFSKTDIPNFNQLIFSWNAYRPLKGYFSFWIQVRDYKTKKWGVWFRMIDWGKDIQKSHCKILYNDSSYHYVRLEVPRDKISDGFRLKVEAIEEADLSYLKMINICVSDFSKFEKESIDDKILKLSTIKVNGVPKKSQMLLNHIDNKKMCSPTSTSMLISYLAGIEIDIINFATKSYDYGLQAYGSWPFNTAYAFEKCPTYFFKVIRLNSFLDLYSLLSKGYPVVISVRGKLNGAPQEYKFGHLILVIGWDKKNKSVVVHDPAFDDEDKIENQYELSAFLTAWERSHRLAYAVEKL